MFGGLPERFEIVFGGLPERFEIVFGGLPKRFDVVFGGEILFDQLDLLTHDGFGLGFGHSGFHQFVNSGMRVKDERRCERHGVNDSE